MHALRLPSHVVRSLHRVLHRAYLRMRIRSAQRDVAFFEREQGRTPFLSHAALYRAQADVARRCIGMWRVELMILEA